MTQQPTYKSASHSDLLCDTCDPHDSDLDGLAHRLLRDVVAPCLPWRSGAAAAAVRSAAVAALSAALERQLVDSASAAALAHDTQLLRSLLSTLGDSATTATKVRGLRAVELLLAAIAAGNDGGPGGGSEPCAAIAGRMPQDGVMPKGGEAVSNSSGGAAGLSQQNWAMACKKLGKRLEDGSDGVRIAACDALAELMRCQTIGIDGDKRQEGNTEPVESPADVSAAAAALRDSLKLHAGDQTPGVRAAAQQALRLSDARLL